VRKTNNMSLVLTGKTRLALFSAFSILTFSGCTKTNVQQVNQVFSAVYTVAAASWTKGTDADGTTFFYATLNVPELTQAIDLNGGVSAYLSFDDPSSTSPTYEAMPEVFDGVAYGVIHTTGSVVVDLRAADGTSLTNAFSAPTLIKVVLMNAQALGN
jgi:hypothetical protein